MTTTLTPRQLRKAARTGQVVIVDSHQPLWKRHAITRWPGVAVILTGRVIRTGWRTSFGRWRTFGWPAWAAALAVTVRTPYAWLAAAAVLAALPYLRHATHRRRRVVSDREAYLWSTGMLAVAACQFLPALLAPLTTVHLPWWAPAAATAPTSITWLWWRRIRKAGAFQRAWETNVTPTRGDFEGTTLRDVRVTVDSDGHPDGTATVVVPKGQTARGISKGDDVLASHLAEAFPVMTAGSCAISYVPGDPVRTARLLVSNPRSLEKPRYWEEPSLDPATGLYRSGHTGHDWHDCKMWQRAGGVNTAAIAGPGKGKGGFTIVTDVEAALSDLVILIVLDGKRGSGLPALKHGAALYARTPGQWIVAWEAAMDIMRLRAEEFGDAGMSLWTPSQQQPLIKVTCDEWRYIHRAWPSMREDAVWWTGQTRSYGGHLHLNLHKGDADGYGDTEIRSNMYSNGQIWMGPAGDLTAQGVATQAWEVDTMSLPPYPGWGHVCQTIDGAAAATTRQRTLWLPTQAEVDLLGCPAPFGTADHHLQREARFPTLPPAQQAILDAARELIESGRADDPKTVEEAKERTAGTAEATADQRILGALYLLDEAGATEIADATGLNRQHVQERLGVLAKADLPMVEQDAPRRPYRLTSHAREEMSLDGLDPTADLESVP